MALDQAGYVSSFASDRAMALDQTGYFSEFDRAMALGQLDCFLLQVAMSASTMARTVA